MFRNNVPTPRDTAPYRRRPQGYASNNSGGGGGNGMKQMLACLVLCALSFYMGALCTMFNDVPQTVPVSHQQAKLTETTTSTSTANDNVASVNSSSSCEEERKELELLNQKLNDKLLKRDRAMDKIVKKKVSIELENLKAKTIDEALKEAKKQQETDDRDPDGPSNLQSDQKDAENLVLPRGIEKIQDVAPIVTANNNKKEEYSRFPSNLHIKGMSLVPKDEFVTAFDYGTPTDLDNSQVVLLYNSINALPTLSSDPKKRKALEKEDGSGIPVLDAESATGQCKTMHVMTYNHGNVGDCTAIVRNYENYHLQKWVRNDEEGRNGPLELVGRGHNDSGGNAFKSPDPLHMDKHFKMLKTYLDTVDEVVEELKPIAEGVAKDNTIVVMTCNMGQSELLMNFVCNSRSKGLDISNVLVFPTDEETKDLAEGLGLTTFYDEKNFGKLPKKEAGFYGDRTFVAMMFAKVVSVQLISKLGYDLLFQDVDVVWFKNPLDYFHDKDNKFYDFDMYFQDDGAHSKRYAPTSANSGFYYVRNNPKTQYFLTSLLYHGDMILRWNSHQQALVQIMADQASLFGLKTKVLDREMEEFPGGWHYNRRKEIMRSIMKGDTNALIFHMSWTSNKSDKLKYYQQMGEWALEQKCIGNKKDQILEEDPDGTSDGDASKPLINACCLPEPKITCHYRDKPSKIPCKDSKSIDKNGRSFWK